MSTLLTLFVTISFKAHLFPVGIDLLIGETLLIWGSSQHVFSSDNPAAWSENADVDTANACTLRLLAHKSYGASTQLVAAPMMQGSECLVRQPVPVPERPCSRVAQAAAPGVAPPPLDLARQNSSAPDPRTPSPP